MRPTREVAGGGEGRENEDHRLPIEVPTRQPWLLQSSSMRLICSINLCWRHPVSKGNSEESKCRPTKLNTKTSRFSLSCFLCGERKKARKEARKKPSILQREENSKGLQKGSSSPYTLWKGEESCFSSLSSGLRTIFIEPRKEVSFYFISFDIQQQLSF